MKNFIEIKADGTVKCLIGNDIVENMKKYKPKGCPFENYSMFDLLSNWINMYSWQIHQREISLIDFIKQIRGDKKVKLYRSTMEKLLQ